VSLAHLANDLRVDSSGDGNAAGPGASSSRSSGQNQSAHHVSKASRTFASAGSGATCVRQISARLSGCEAGIFRSRR
jgi:hypothetical protein